MTIHKIIKIINALNRLSTALSTAENFGVTNIEIVDCLEGHHIDKEEAGQLRRKLCELAK